MARSLDASEGIILWSPQTVYGTAVAPVNSLGIVEYNVTDEGDFRQFFTIGKVFLHKNKAGIAKLDWQVQLPSIGSTTFLQNIIRASDHQPPWFTLGTGSNDGSVNEGDQWRDCKMGQCELSLSGGGILSATAGGMGGAKTALNSMVADAGSDNPLFSYESVTSLAAGAFENKQFRFTVDNQLEVESVNRGVVRTSGERRLWDYMHAGNCEINGSVTLARKYSKDFQALCPAHDGDMIFQLTEACNAAHVITITLSDVEFLKQTRNTPNRGKVNFELPFNAKNITIAEVFV